MKRRLFWGPCVRSLTGALITALLMSFLLPSSIWSLIRPLPPFLLHSSLFSFWNHCLWLDCAHASVTWCNHILSHICVSFMAPCFNNLLLVSTFSMTQRKRNAFVVCINIALWGQLSVNKACCWQGDGGQEWTIRVSAGDLQGYITRRGLREAPNLSGDLGSSTAFRIMICIMKHQSTLRESLRG